MDSPKQFTGLQRILAWSVHIFTASGLLAGFMAILAINAKDWQAAMLWLLLCQFIDGIDGTFARLFRVKEVLPEMDGKTIDYVIIYQADLLEEPWRLSSTFLILLVSAIYYGKDGMVSEDNYFVGFPVMWNAVVFFLVFVYDLSPHWNALVILFFAILHFVPIKFVYPSRGRRYRWLTLVITAISLVLAILLLLLYPERPWYMVLAITVALFYYGVRAILDTWAN